MHYKTGYEQVAAAFDIDMMTNDFEQESHPNASSRLMFKEAVDAYTAKDDRGVSGSEDEANVYVLE